MTSQLGLWSALALIAGLLSGCGHREASGATLPLHLVQDVPLPGDTSRFDYQDVDPVRRRLFVAHLGASRLEVIDLDSLRVVRSVTGLADVHGVRVAPSLGRIYASATGSNEVVTLDEDSLSEIGRAQTDGYPDGIGVDVATQRAFVSDEHGDAETVIDARTGARVGTVALGGEAGNVAVDPTANRILVGVQTRREIATIDPATLAVVHRTLLPGCDNDHGLLIDPLHRLAFVACDGNDRMLVVDLASGRTTATFSVGKGPDVLALDQGLGRLYVAAESGTVSVFSVAEGSVRFRSRRHLAKNAHSVAVDPTTHRVFFPLQSQRGRPVLRVMAPT
ncbi:MAG TPA: YncE family protein [Acidimicrobiales bacterium]|nr:YncE family protein [Acidimicrobiales bacterium]